MTTLLITIKAPIQSWGYGEAYQRRDTADRPTKSGVIGLCASALGRDRGADLTDLTRLRFGVRDIRPGTHMDDFQTMGVRADHKPNPLETKEYLLDAEFLVGLEGDGQLVNRLASAINHPIYMPYLGRRACPPAGPIPVTVSSEPLEQALAGDGEIRIESDHGETRWDMPYPDREFGSRTETLIDPFLDFAKGNTK